MQKYNLKNYILYYLELKITQQAPKQEKTPAARGGAPKPNMK